MLEFLKNYELSFLLPKIFRNYAENKTADDKFGQNNLSSLFLDNATSLILASFLIPWIIVLFIKIFKHFCLQKIKKRKNFFEAIEKFVMYNLIFLLFQNSMQEISLFIALQLKFLSVSNTYNIFSSLFCFLYLGINIVIILWLRKIIINICSIKNSRFLLFDSKFKSYELIFNDLNIENDYTLYYPLIKMIKKYFLSFFIVFLYEEIIALIISLSFLTLSMYLIITIIEPFSDKYRNIVARLTEFLQFLLYLHLFLYQKSKISTIDDTALYVGYFTIVILTIIIILNFGMLLVNIILLTFRYFFKINLLQHEIKLGEYLSKKMDSWHMEQFSYEKIRKDVKTGKIYQEIFRRRVMDKKSNRRTLNKSSSNSGKKQSSSNSGKKQSNNSHDEFFEIFANHKKKSKLNKDESHHKPRESENLNENEIEGSQINLKQKDYFDVSKEEKNYNNEDDSTQRMPLDKLL